MAADSTAYGAVMKEVWHPDRLESQLYQENPFLDSLEKRQPSAQHGDKVLTPIHTGRGGGYTVVPRAGSSNLNSATSQEVNQAEWTYTHHWRPIAIESNTIDETSGNANAVAEVVETEVTGALDDLRKQISRQVFRNGDALIAECTTTSSSNTVNLVTTGYGYDAIVRGHLHEDLTIDIGTTSNEVSVAADRTISSIDEDASDPEIVISGAAVTTAAGDYVSIANARSGSTSYEMNGLQNSYGSTSAVLGALDPATVTRWKPGFVDSSTTTITLPKLYEGRRAIVQRGSQPDWVITSLKQQEALYKLVQPQARFQGDKDLGVGDVDAFRHAKMTIDAHPDVYDRQLFYLTKKHIFLVRTKKPVWAPTEYEGGGGGPLRWSQDTTALVSALVYRIQLGTSRRNSGGAFTALTD